MVAQPERAATMATAAKARRILAGDTLLAATDVATAVELGHGGEAEVLPG